VLPPARYPLRDFWATIRVELRVPVEIKDPDDSAPTFAAGYYRIFGIRATSDTVRGLMEAEVGEDIVVWSDSSWEEIDLNTLERTIEERIADVEGEGIWYRSGRVFFSDSEQ
jgi:hypothetical protein